MNDAQGFETFQVPKADELSGMEFAVVLCLNVSHLYSCMTSCFMIRVPAPVKLV